MYIVVINSRYKKNKRIINRQVTTSTSLIHTYLKLYQTIEIINIYIYITNTDVINQDMIVPIYIIIKSFNEHVHDTHVRTKMYRREIAIIDLLVILV